MMQSGKHQVTPKVSWKNGKAEIEIEIVEKTCKEQMFGKEGSVRGKPWETFGKGGSVRGKS